MQVDMRVLRRVILGAAGGLGAAWFSEPGLYSSTRGSAVLDVLSVLLGCGLLVLGFKVLHRKRLLENVPTSRVRSVAMGYAELLGIAQNRTPLVAPYSGIPCVYYRYLLEEEVRTGRGRRRWSTVDRGETSDPFYLKDETGALLVDPVGAETVLERSFRKVERGEGWLGRRQRFNEWWIVPGQKVFVAGTVRRLRDVVLERRAVLGDRLRTLKSDPEKMKAVDADQDGRISSEEWGNAVRAVQDEIVREDAEAPPEPPEETIAIGKGSDETMFVIAARGEKTVLGRLGLEAAGSLAGGALAVVVFAVSLLSRAGLLPGGWVFSW